jgi:acyl carrier protein
VSLPEGAPPTQAQVLDHVRAVMKRELGLRLDALLPTTRLVDDLDLDSIDLVDLTAALEEQLGLSFRTEELGSVRSIQDVVDLIQAGLAARHDRQG